MIENLTHATLGSTEKPCEVAAARLAVKHSLIPPVDIHALASAYASVIEEDWPDSGCDALVFNLDSNRPSILLRQRSYWRRKRFSLAHELGHVKMGWHLAVLGCNPSSDGSDADVGQLTVSGSVLTIEQLKRQEEEATIFASHVLIPDAWLRTQLALGELGEALRAINTADVSAWASMKRLSASLKAGFLFTFEDPERFRIFPSPGTRVPPSVYEGDLAEARRRATSFGETTIGGRAVSWFQFVNYSDAALENRVVARSSNELLRSAIDLAYPDEGLTTYVQSINGVVGAAFTSHRSQIESVRDLRALIEHRCLSKYPELGASEEFGNYLTSRALELWARL